MVNKVMNPLLKRFGVAKENGLSPFYGYFASKQELKHELELFFPESSKISNKKIIVDHSDSDQESKNKEFIYEDVCDNTTKEGISIERVLNMV